MFHHLPLTVVLIILPMIFIHHLRLTDLKILVILSHTTLNPTHKNHSSNCHKIVLLMKHPHLILILISSLTRASLRAAFQPPHLIILLIIKARMLHTPPSQLLFQVIHQLLNTIQAAEMRPFQSLHQVLPKHINMTAITSHQQRKLLRHTRLQGLRLGLWHLMMYQLQWTSLKNPLNC